VAVALGPGPAPARAQTGVGGTVDTTGVTITIVRWQDRDSVYATGADGGADPTGCDWAIVPAPLGTLPPPGLPPWRPDSYLGLLTCDGVGVEVRWVGPDDVVDLAAEARRLVEQRVAHVAVPRISVHANPAPAGLVGVPSWFWIQGYDGRPILEEITALGVTVEVRIDPTAVRWAFGDGSRLEGGLGHPPPGASEISHVFDRHGTRPATARLELVPHYRVAGAEWLALGGIPLEGELRYHVREVQAYLVRR